MEDIKNYIINLRTVKQFAKIENVSHQYIYQLISNKIILPLVIGGIKFIDISLYKNIKSVEKASKTQIKIPI